MNLGQFIEFHRKRRGLTQEELGKRIGKNKTFIYRIEKNHVKSLKDDVMKNLADALGIPVIALFEGFDIDGNPKENVENITREEIVQEITKLLAQTDDFTEQQKQHIISTINLFNSSNQD